MLKLNAWDKEHNAYLVVDKYSYNGNTAIQIVTEDEDGALVPWSCLTVNLGKLPANFAYIDINNNSDGVCEWIEKNHLGKLTGVVGFSGYCVYPLCELNLDEIKRHEPPKDKPCFL